MEKSCARVGVVKMKFSPGYLKNANMFGSGLKELSVVKFRPGHSTEI